MYKCHDLDIDGVALRAVAGTVMVSDAIKLAAACSDRHAAERGILTVTARSLSRACTRAGVEPAMRVCDLIAKYADVPDQITYDALDAAIQALLDGDRDPYTSASWSACSGWDVIRDEVIDFVEIWRYAESFGLPIVASQCAAILEVARDSDHIDQRADFGEVFGFTPSSS